jgi:hypothetical protein
MGATTVTGKGRGMAKNLKGPGNERNYFVPQVTPHIVLAGRASITGGQGTVTFPNPLAGAAVDYVVMLQVNNTVAAAHGATVHTKTDTNGKFASFIIKTENATETVEYMIVKAGFGLEA